MPIKPEHRARYPDNWPQISAAIRARAQNRCEECRVRNHAWGWRKKDGTFVEVPKRPLIEDGYGRPPFTLLVGAGMVKVIEIVLTTAHLDHTPENCDPANLRAWCQRCHLAYDRRARRSLWRPAPLFLRDGSIP